MVSFIVFIAPQGVDSPIEWASAFIIAGIQESDDGSDAQERGNEKDEMKDEMNPEEFCTRI